MKHYCLLTPRETEVGIPVWLGNESCSAIVRQARLITE